MQQPHIKFSEALLVWVKVGLMSFGDLVGGALGLIYHFVSNHFRGAP